MPTMIQLIGAHQCAPQTGCPAGGQPAVRSPARYSSSRFPSGRRMSLTSR